jgi:hypothetical protein
MSETLLSPDFRKYPWYIWVCVAAAGFVVLGVIIMGAMALREPCETDFHGPLAWVLEYRSDAELENWYKQDVVNKSKLYAKKFTDLETARNLAEVMSTEDLKALYSQSNKKIKAEIEKIKAG